jgi:hypothetical protein
MESRWIVMDDFEKGFPITESYRNAAGQNIEFSINAEEFAGGCSVTAIETDKSRGKRIGCHFRVFSNTLTESLWLSGWFLTPRPLRLIPFGRPDQPLQAFCRRAAPCFLMKTADTNNAATMPRC